MVGKRRARQLAVGCGLGLAVAGGLGAPTVAAPVPTPSAAATRAAPTKSSPGPTPRTGRAGMSDRAVRSLHDALVRLGYFVPAPNGHYDYGTSQAVTALQKAAGLTRTGDYDAATAAAVRRGVAPTARSRGRGRLVEVDLDRQLLLLVQDGRVVTVINTSTGLLPVFATPRGRFRVFRQVNAWEKAPLGELYRPRYFYRGYAIHGVRDGSIPVVPASHGCARVSTAAMDRLWGPGGLRVGDPVWVY